MKLDKHNQPLTHNFNKNRNIEKAVSGLFGIISGITADKKMNSQEMLFLDVWLRSQKHLRGDGDLIDILDLIGDILEDGVVTTAELLDLNNLLRDISEYRDMPYSNEEAKVNELLGILNGISADGVLDDAEIGFLTGWLDDHHHLDEVWPLSVVERRLKEFLEDGEIDLQERLDLLDTFKQICGHNFEESSIAYGMSTDFLEDPISELVHEGSCFCFTGKFVTGSRKTIELSAQLRGSSTAKNLSKKVDYVVIGTLASRDWRFTSHGRKIERALELKSEGIPIKILTERTWLQLI